MSQQGVPPPALNGTSSSPQMSVVTSTMAAAAAQLQAQAQAQQAAHQAHAQAQAALAVSAHLGSLPMAGGGPISAGSSMPNSLQMSAHQLTMGLGLPNGMPSLPIQSRMQSQPPPSTPTSSSASASSNARAGPVSAPTSAPAPPLMVLNQNTPTTMAANGSRPSTASVGGGPCPPVVSNAPAPIPQQQPPPKRSEIYRYESSKPLYAAAWSHKKNDRFRLAVSTVVDRDMGNKVSIIELDDNVNRLVERGSFSHEFPPNGLGFIPDPNNMYPELLATCGDFLRLFKVSPETIITEECVLTSNKSSQYSAPLTSFDWNDIDPTLIGTSSVDTTCTIFDIEMGTAIASTRPTSYQVKTQLIAHDKPVHDIAFSKIHNGKDHFATVGADGSARMFDLRHLEHSTIVWEDVQKTPLMRLAWNKHEPFHLATYAQDSPEVIVIDIRMPCNALVRLKNHNGAINGIAWAPHSPHHICTAVSGDDSQALIWDLQNMPRPIEDPILAYSAGGEVNQVHWGAAHTNWICICFNKTLEILRV